MVRVDEVLSSISSVFIVFMCCILIPDSICSITIFEIDNVIVIVAVILIISIVVAVRYFSSLCSLCTPSSLDTSIPLFTP